MLFRSGVHATRQVSVRVAQVADIQRIMRHIRDTPPSSVGGVDVHQVVDLLSEGDLPPTDGIVFQLAGRTRIIVRPSGTEPKVKAYLQVVHEVDESLTSARTEAEQRLSELEDAVREWFA